MDKYEKKIQADMNAILNLMTRRGVDEIQLALIRYAFEFAREAHRGQVRKSGEPYICHPVAVALIVASELGLGANAVIAALLHDVVEDTIYTLADIRERFGDDVAFLVGVVTKQKKAKYDKSKQVDNYRQILSSVEYDVRAILIKLADRMHNMRTLESMRPDKQMKIAGETDYFYAPLANRLGLYDAKVELENLSFRFRCPREYDKMVGLVADQKVADRQEIEDFMAQVRQVLDDNGIGARLELVYRHPYNVWCRMQSKGCDFRHVEGKHYLRIVYDANSMADEKMQSLRIYAALTDCFKELPGSVANYINTPKENGYRSFHVKMLNQQGHWEEMHVSSERMVRNNRMGCTAERTEENVEAWLRKFKEVLKDIAFHSKEVEFMDGVRASFYNDNIIAFTPKGRGIILPKGATALDFAYEIHTQVGHHAVYARVNGKLCSVKTRLHRCDCVEIGTDNEALPEKDWPEHVTTYKAKRSLGCFFADSPVMEYRRCACCHPLPGDEVVGFKDANGNITLHKRTCTTAIRQASEQGDTIVDVDFKENAAFLFPVRVHIRGIDRRHLLSDVVACITEQQSLSISKLVTETNDRIVETTVDFSVHSADELQQAIDSIDSIKNVDEVSRVDVE